MFNRKLASALALTAVIATLSAIPASAAEPSQPAASFKAAEVSISSVAGADTGSKIKKGLLPDVKFVRKIALNGAQKIGSDSVTITITPKGE